MKKSPLLFDLVGTVRLNPVSPSFPVASTRLGTSAAALGFSPRFWNCARQSKIKDPLKLGRATHEADVRFATKATQLMPAPVGRSASRTLLVVIVHSASGGIGATRGDAGFRPISLIRRLVDATSARETICGAKSDDIGRKN